MDGTTLTCIIRMRTMLYSRFSIIKAHALQQVNLIPQGSLQHLVVVVVGHMSQLIPVEVLFPAYLALYSSVGAATSAASPIPILQFVNNIIICNYSCLVIRKKLYTYLYNCSVC